MNVTHYIGFDVHKKSVSYCVKTGDGRIVEEGKLPATRQALRQWAQQPLRGGARSPAPAATPFALLCTLPVHANRANRCADSA